MVEYAVIVAHVRLLTELKDQADQMREARYGSAAATVVDGIRQPDALVSDPPVPLT